MNRIDALLKLVALDAEDSTSTNPTGPWRTGEDYLIRTVTMTLTGRLVAVYPGELVLADAAWVANTGRFADAVRDGKLDEVEPFVEDVIVGRGAVVDATRIGWPLPRDQK